jgi:transcription elongation factor Elf1
MPLSHAIFVVVCTEKNKDTDESLFWNNEQGWVDHISFADKFNEDEKRRLQLPSNGAWKLVPRRFQDALAIQEGACNPAGIALSLHYACVECLHDNVSQREDPAVRLITHQLSYLMNVPEVDNTLHLYSSLIDYCKEKARKPFSSNDQKE